jgi:hypothetical protein
MKGDFTRNTYEPGNHFSRVLMQQGRVQLDADWNEQAAILLNYLRALAADIIGPHGGPGESFKVDPNGDGKDFVISKGHYYVDGILCENGEALAYTNQKNYPLEEGDQLENNQNYLVYLDVWERLITYIQNPGIREIALGGPDTAARAKVIWQVKVDPDRELGECPGDPKWENLLQKWQPTNRGLLKASVKEFDISEADPCITSPDSRYRGVENQLYRVEIHKAGNAKSATFKWSRENGSVVFPIKNLETDTDSNTTTVTLEHLGRDDRFSLQEGEWVELVDDDYTLRGEVQPLQKVTHVDRQDMRVILEGAVESDIAQIPSLHPLIRRWDHKKLDPTLGYPTLDEENGTLLINEGDWLMLEDGVQICFDQASGEDKIHNYRTGDYWLIPARTATGDIEWPRFEEDPLSVPPHGVEHHYAPLAVISVDSDGTVQIKEDCRLRIDQVGGTV